MKTHPIGTGEENHLMNAPLLFWNEKRSCRCSPNTFYPMANFFYFDNNGTKQGPVSYAQLKDLVNQGIITPQTDTWTDSGQSGKAGQINGLFPMPAENPFASPPIQQPMIYCWGCGNQILASAFSCPKCGTLIAKSNQNPLAADAQKFRTVYILLALLVGGGFGIHNFYAGRTNTAFIQLILALTVIGLVVTIIWSTIECFTVTTDGLGRPFA